MQPIKQRLWMHTDIQISPRNFRYNFIFLDASLFQIQIFQSLNRRKEKIRTNELWSKTFLLSRFKCFYSSRIGYKKYLLLKIEN